MIELLEYWYPGADNLSAYKSNGDLVAPAAPKFGSDVAGVTLEAATYYIPLARSDKAPIGFRASIVNFHIKWAAAVAGVFTIETSSFSKYLEPGNNAGPVVVSDYDTTAGNWVPWNSPASYVPVTGSGNSSSAATVTAGGSAAGGCSFDISNFGALRLRIKAVLTAGGLCRFGANGKVGA